MNDSMLFKFLLLVGLCWAFDQNYHYFLKKEAQKGSTSEGVRYWKWEGTPEGHIDFSYGYPSAILFEFRHKGQELVSQPFWAHGDIYYVVLEGKIDFGDNEFVSKPVPTNETVWVRAGTPVQKVAAATEKALLIAIGADFEINVDNFPNLNTSETLRELRLSTSAGYHYAMANSHVRPNPTNPTNLTNHNWGGPQEEGGIPPLLMVTWMADSMLPTHYHPTSALYVLQQGEFYFPGEWVQMQVGEMRWVAPGHLYDGEGSMSNGANILVLGADSNPTFQENQPDMPYVMAHTHQSHTIFSGVNVNKLTVQDL